MRAVVAALWRARLEQLDPGWIDLAYAVPRLDSTRAREVPGPVSPALGGRRRRGDGRRHAVRLSGSSAVLRRRTVAGNLAGAWSEGPIHRRFRPSPSGGASSPGAGSRHGRLPATRDRAARDARRCKRPITDLSPAKPEVHRVSRTDACQHPARACAPRSWRGPVMGGVWPQPADAPGSPSAFGGVTMVLSSSSSGEDGKPASVASTSGSSGVAGRSGVSLPSGSSMDSARSTGSIAGLGRVRSSSCLAGIPNRLNDPHACGLGTDSGIVSGGSGDGSPGPGATGSMSGSSGWMGSGFGSVVTVHSVVRGRRLRSWGREGCRPQ